MAAPLTLLESATSHGIRVKNYGDIVVVTMPGTAFSTTARDHVQAQQWARAKASLGNSQRDRSAYCDRHVTLLARSKSGLATRGSSEALASLARAMRESGILLNEWAIPAPVLQVLESEGPLQATPPPEGNA